jgi:DNA invertase Pin-like site-specific DNA recombinase
MGCEIVRVYKDHGISGAKSRDERPEFDRLLRDAAQRKFDMVMAWSVDRLGRSLQDLVGFLSELHALHIDLFLHQQGLDTTTPGGKAMFQMLGVFAEFERAMIAEPSGLINPTYNVRKRGADVESAPGLGEPRARANGLAGLR